MSKRWKVPISILPGIGTFLVFHLFARNGFPFSLFAGAVVFGMMLVIENLRGRNLACPTAVSMDGARNTRQRAVFWTAFAVCALVALFGLRRGTNDVLRGVAVFLKGFAGLAAVSVIYQYWPFISSTWNRVSNARIFKTKAYKITVYALWLVIAAYYIPFCGRYIYFSIREWREPAFVETIQLYQNSDTEAVTRLKSLARYIGKSGGTSHHFVGAAANGKYLNSLCEIEDLRHMPDTLPELFAINQALLDSYLLFFNGEPLAYEFTDTKLYAQRLYDHSLMSFMTTAHLLRLQVRWALRNARYDKAFVLTSRIITIGEVFDRIQGPILYPLVGYSVKETAADAAGDCLRYSPINLRMPFSRLADKLLHARVYDTGLINSVKAGYFSRKNSLYELSTGRSIVGEKADMDPGPVVRLLNRPFFSLDETWKMNQEDMLKVIRAAGHPYYLVDTSTFFRSFPQIDYDANFIEQMIYREKHKWRHPTNDIGVACYMIISSFNQTYARTMEHRAECEAKLAAAALACRLRLFDTIDRAGMDTELLTNPLTGERFTVSPKDRTVRVQLADNKTWEVRY